MCRTSLHICTADYGSLINMRAGRSNLDFHGASNIETTEVWNPCGTPLCRNDVEEAASRTFNYAVQALHPVAPYTEPSSMRLAKAENMNLVLTTAKLIHLKMYTAVR